MNLWFRATSAILCLCFAWALSAHATDHNANCQQSGEEKTAECEAIGKGAEGANTGQANGIGSSMPGKQINIGAQGQRQSALDSAKNLNAAKDQCGQKKSECEQKCDDEAQKADQDAQQAQNQDPQHQCNAQCMNYRQQASQIRSSTKNSSCTAPIAGKMAELGQGAQDAQNAANQAGNTQNSSPGMPPIPPMPSPSPKDTPSPTPTPDPTLTPQPDKYGCATDPNAATLSKCTSDMLKKCTAGNGADLPSDPVCDTFSAHYCYTTSPNATQFSTLNDPTSGTSRPGSGVGTNYCNNVIAKNFCQDSNHSKCATCQNYRNQFSDACKQNPSSCAPVATTSQCPDAEPPIATTLPTGTSPVSGGGSTGGGGGGGERFSGVQNAQVANKEGAAPGAGGPKIDLAVSEGGGGGSSASSSYGNDSFASKYRPKETSVAAATTANGRGPASTELSGTAGPSLFGITSAQIQRMCGRNQLHCGSL